MFQGKFQGGIEEAKKLILNLLSEKEIARWSDFEKLGIPRATLYRALKELELKGEIVKEGRRYALRSRNYEAVIRSRYAPSLCRLIGCEDDEGLAESLKSLVGENIKIVESLHEKFLARYQEIIETTFKPPLSPLTPLIKGVIKALYSDRAFYTLVMTEVSKCFKGFEAMAECEELEEDVRGIARTILNTIKGAYGIDEKVVEVFDKIRTTLQKHGYRGFIRISVFGTITESISVDDLIPSMLGYFKTEECLQLLYKLSRRFEEEGCRPLSKKEREEFSKCEE
jgi:hypothetical protein